MTDESEQQETEADDPTEDLDLPENLAEETKGGRDTKCAACEG